VKAIVDTFSQENSAVVVEPITEEAMLKKMSQHYNVSLMEIKDLQQDLKDENLKDKKK